MSKSIITRRKFVKAAVATATTISALPLLNKRVHAQSPKSGGHLRIGQSRSSSTFTFDPLTNTDNAAYQIQAQCRNLLVEIDYEGNALPELAEAWEASDGARKWVFRIRDGVEFHNGKTLDVEDVISSINYHIEAGGRTPIKSVVDQIEEMKADGKNLIIQLKSGNADLPWSLAAKQLVIGIAGWDAAEWEKGVGTGGYVLESIDPGVRCITKRNPNYWKEGRAHFDSVETRGINDSTARLNALRTKQVDFADAVDLHIVDRLKQDSSINVTTVDGLRHASIPMWADTAPFDDLDVRLAMKYAINRQEILDKVGRGFGSIGNDHPISRRMKFYSKGLPQREYDPDKAKFHLKRAGRESLSISLPVSPGLFSGAVDLAVLYKQQAAAAGINIEVQRAPDDGYWSDVWMKRPICVATWSGRPTVDEMLTTTYLSTASWNDSHWKNEEFDRLVTQARAELDESKRAEMYEEAIGLVRDDGAVIVPLFLSYVEASTNRLAHGVISGNRPLDDCRIAERWWFES